MKGIISEKLRRRLRRIVRKEMGVFYNDKAHGFKHLYEVHKNFISLVKSKPKVNRDILESLECAVILHDIGRAFIDSKKHGEKSAEIIKRVLKNEKDLKLPNKEWIVYAVRWHSECDEIFRKQKTEPRKGKEEWICLAFLTFLDHMDTLGERGIRRAKEYLGKEVPLIPKDGPHVKLTKIKNLKAWFKNPRRENIKRVRKKKSLLEHLLSNYFWIDKNIPRVKKYIGKEFEERYKKMGKPIEKYLLHLIWKSSFYLDRLGREKVN